MNKQAKLNRYLRLVEWARKRYTVDGVLDITPGRKYDLLERAAWSRYTNLNW
jgi:hypothetical protein